MQKARLLTPSRFLRLRDSLSEKGAPNAEFQSDNEISTETRQT